MVNVFKRPQNNAEAWWLNTIEDRFQIGNLSSEIQWSNAFNESKIADKLPMHMQMHIVNGHMYGYI